MTFERLVLPDLRVGLPDSLVVAPKGGLLTRSGAVIHLSSDGSCVAPGGRPVGLDPRPPARLGL